MVADINGGSIASILSDPKRENRVSLPGSFSGLSVSIRRSRPSAVSLGPTFMPMGFFTPRQNSTWAPSIWRVRSPIQTMCAEVSYQSPEVESTRVMASSKPSNRASWAVNTST